MGRLGAAEAVQRVFGQRFGTMPPPVPVPQFSSSGVVPVARALPPVEQIPVAPPQHVSAPPQAAPPTYHTQPTAQVPAQPVVQPTPNPMAELEETPAPPSAQPAVRPQMGFGGFGLGLLGAGGLSGAQGYRPDMMGWLSQRPRADAGREALRAWIRAMPQRSFAERSVPRRPYGGV